MVSTSMILCAYQSLGLLPGQEIFIHAYIVGIGRGGHFPRRRRIDRKPDTSVNLGLEIVHLCQLRVANGRFFNGAWCVPVSRFLPRRKPFICAYTFGISRGGNFPCHGRIDQRPGTFVDFGLQMHDFQWILLPIGSRVFSGAEIVLYMLILSG